MSYTLDAGAMTVSEVISKVQMELEEWVEKRIAAENSIRTAIANINRLRQTLNVFQGYVSGDLAADQERVAIRKTTIRQAIKNTLQLAQGPLTTREIGEVLEVRGMTCSRSSISETLCVMRDRHHEVHKTSQGWIAAQANLDSTKAENEVNAEPEEVMV